MSNSLLLSEALSTPISQPLTPSTVASHLSVSPWRQVPGAFNLRSVSHLPLVKENFIYRSGMLNLLSNQGKKDIYTSLGIRAVHDLRDAEEKKADPEPAIDGARMMGIDVESEEADVEWTSVSFDSEGNQKSKRKR